MLPGLNKTAPNRSPSGFSSLLEHEAEQLQTKKLRSGITVVFFNGRLFIMFVRISSYARQHLAFAVQLPPASRTILSGRSYRKICANNTIFIIILVILCWHALCAHVIRDSRSSCRGVIAGRPKLAGDAIRAVLLRHSSRIKA